MENRTINIAVVAEVAKALKNIKKDMVFVGGAVVSLYTDDPAADEIKPLLVSAKLRPTKPQIKNLSWDSNLPFNAVVFVGLNVICAEASRNGAKFQFDSLGSWCVS
jgi:hypothetical protein